MQCRVGALYMLCAEGHFFYFNFISAAHLLERSPPLIVLLQSPPALLPPTPDYSRIRAPPHSGGLYITKPGSFSSSCILVVHSCASQWCYSRGLWSHL